MKPRIMRAASRPTTKAEPANFVGTVLSDPVFTPEQPSRLRASRVSFMPGGRTNWHKHAVGQILYVLSGVGRYQLEGEPVQEIKPGDTVVIPPNARHWHGSAPDTMMVHLAMSETNDKGEATSWFEPVSDTDYTKSPAKAKPVAVPPTVSASMRKVGWPTPTGTPWPSLPQVPMPGSSAMSLPTMPTLVSASAPAPIKVAPFTGAPSLPSSIR
jgi:quercetin dioxygenase-like cupin family protein